MNKYDLIDVSEILRIYLYGKKVENILKDFYKYYTENITAHMRTTINYVNQ
jgi:hypothetical protein